jgi:serine/threonine protein kinase
MATIGEKTNLMDLLSKNSVVPLDLDHKLRGLIYVVREQTFYTNDQIIWKQFKEYRKDTNEEYQAFIENEEIIMAFLRNTLLNPYSEKHNNENIIKLYDIKKTANNFYLILEYCNEGDLNDYLK